MTESDPSSGANTRVAVEETPTTRTFIEFEPGSGSNQLVRGFRVIQDLVPGTVTEDLAGGTITEPDRWVERTRSLDGWYVPTPTGDFRRASSEEIAALGFGLETQVSGGGGGGGGGTSFSVSDVGPVSAALQQAQIDEQRRAALAGESFDQQRLTLEADMFNQQQVAARQALQLEADQFNLDYSLRVEGLNEQIRQADNSLEFERENLRFLQERFRVETEMENRQLALQTEGLIESTRARIESNRIDRERMSLELNAINAQHEIDTRIFNSQQNLRTQELEEQRRQFNIQQKESIANSVANFQARPGDLGKLSGFLTSLEQSLPGSLGLDDSFITQRSLAPLEILLNAQNAIDDFDPFTQERVTAPTIDQGVVGGGTSPDQQSAQEAAIRAAAGGDVTAQPVQSGNFTIGTGVIPGEGVDLSGEGPTNVTVTPGATPEADPVVTTDTDGDGTPDTTTAPPATTAPPTVERTPVIDNDNDPNLFVFPDGSTIPGVTVGVGPDGEPTPNYFAATAPNSPALQGDPNFGTFDPDQIDVFAPDEGSRWFGFVPEEQTIDPFNSTVKEDELAAARPALSEPQTMEQAIALNPELAAAFFEGLYTDPNSFEGLTAQSEARPISYGGVDEPVFGTTPYQTDPGSGEFFNADEFGFADGGVGFFGGPATINVGEKEPEIVTATPISQIGNDPAVSGNTQSFFERTAERALNLSGLGRDFNPLDVAGPNIDPILIERAAALASARRGIDPEFFKRRAALLNPTGVREGAVGRTR